MAKGTITLYKGKSKKTGKPFSALMLEAGKFSTLYFVDSALELDYLERYLDVYEQPNNRNAVEQPKSNDPDTSIDLNSNDTPDGGWFDN